PDIDNKDSLCDHDLSFYRWLIRKSAVKMLSLTPYAIPTSAAFRRRKLYFAPRYSMRKLHGKTATRVKVFFSDRADRVWQPDADAKSTRSQPTAPGLERRRQSGDGSIDPAGLRGTAPAGETAHAP